MAGHYIELGLAGNIVTFRDREAAIDLQMDIGEDHVARLAGLQFVHPENTWGRPDFGGDPLDLLLGGCAVHQVMECIPEELPAHFDDHETNDQCGYGVEDCESKKIASDTDSDH